ncbi:PEP-CTERM sorting domain-containing protein [Marinimicrobium alkaliphilum]|uniref:PEP-CTERM sorting domain-containing protein n=1 Tax=Marinimicrobium alkaliphilum TaxID=2202654 RepID=UPI000DBA39F7|nr:PEP-CTERM sorting domain-containing protein [Marinimicrobium alkaliphilum]
MTRQWIKGLILAATLGTSGVASGAMIVVSGQAGGSGSLDNVLSKACNGNITGPATRIQGCLNTDHDFLVDFTSDQNLVFGGGGQAMLMAESGSLNWLTISLADPGFTFSTLQLNINANANGTVTFSGAPGGESDPMALRRNGQNRFTIFGEHFSSLTFFTSAGINSVDFLADDLRQVRLGGIQPVAVPEPGAAAMLGLGLLCLVMIRRRNRQQDESAV